MGGVAELQRPLICKDLAEVISGANSPCGTLISPRYMYWSRSCIWKGFMSMKCKVCFLPSPLARMDLFEEITFYKVTKNGFEILPQNWTGGPQDEAMSLQADLAAGDGHIGQTLLPAQVLHEPEKAGMVLVPLEHIHGIGGRGGHVFPLKSWKCAMAVFSLDPTWTEPCACALTPCTKEATGALKSLRSVAV